MNLFFSNPNFRESVALLRELHLLLQKQEDETEIGEAIRDRLDIVIKEFTQEEIDSFNGISEDFYSLTDEIVSRNVVELVDVQFQKSLHLTLDWLRDHALQIDPAALSYARGTVFQAAGDLASANLFFQHAHELDSDNKSYDFASKNTLKQENEDD